MHAYYAAPYPLHYRADFFSPPSFFSRMLAKAKSRSTNPPKPRLPSEKALEIRIFIGPFHVSPHDVPESIVTFSVVCAGKRNKFDSFLTSKATGKFGSPPDAEKRSNLRSVGRPLRARRVPLKGKGVVSCERVSASLSMSS